MKSSRHESVGAVLKSWLLNGAGKVMGSQSLSRTKTEAGIWPSATSPGNP